MEPRQKPVDPAALALEREIELVRGAIAFVAQGGARRVVVGSLRFGEPILELARAMAAEAGVRVVPLWTTDEVGADLAIERIDNA